MFKYKVITVFLLTTILISGEAYCQQASKHLQVSTIFGKIDKVDVEGGVINVKTDNGTMVFYILTESKLFRGSHHMSSIEIEQGDSVRINYVSSSGQNDVISLVDKKSGD